MLKNNETYCPHCGHKVAQNADFCHYCGAKLPRVAMQSTSNNNTPSGNQLTNSKPILSLKRFFLNYFNFNGYSSTSDYGFMYMWFIVGIFLVNIICSLATGSVTKRYDELDAAGQPAYYLFMLIPIISLSWRHYMTTKQHTFFNSFKFILFIALDLLFIFAALVS